MVPEVQVVPLLAGWSILNTIIQSFCLYSVNLVFRYKRQTDDANAGQYHYHGNINCTNAGAATGATDPDMCKLIGYYRDGVPVYGFCKDSNGKSINYS